MSLIGPLFFCLICFLEEFTPQDVGVAVARRENMTSIHHPAGENDKYHQGIHQDPGNGVEDIFV